MCDGLNPLGWSVEVDAEPGRFVEFGNEVLESRLPDDEGDDDDFDAAVVHLGSNYNLDQDNYLEELNEILYRIAPRPTLLMTVTEYRPAWSEVNETIRELARLYDNVTVVDWEKIARTPGVLSRDGLHPGDQGEDVLIELLAVALGEVGDEEGECLRSSLHRRLGRRTGFGPERWRRIVVGEFVGWLVVREFVVGEFVGQHLIRRDHIGWLHDRRFDDR